MRHVSWAIAYNDHDIYVFPTDYYIFVYSVFSSASVSLRVVLSFWRWWCERDMNESYTLALRKRSFKKMAIKRLTHTNTGANNLYIDKMKKKLITRGTDPFFINSFYFCHWSNMWKIWTSSSSFWGCDDIPTNPHTWSSVCVCIDFTKVS